MQDIPQPIEVIGNGFVPGIPGIYGNMTIPAKQPTSTSDTSPSSLEPVVLTPPQASPSDISPQPQPMQSQAATPLNGG